MNGTSWCYSGVCLAASYLPEDERLRLPVGQEPGAGAGRQGGEDQVKCRRQLSSLHLLRLKVLEGHSTVERWLWPHLSSKECSDNEQDAKDEADDLAKEGHTIGRALHPGGGVGTEDSVPAGIPGQY